MVKLYQEGIIRKFKKSFGVKKGRGGLKGKGATDFLSVKEKLNISKIANDCKANPILCDKIQPYLHLIA